MWVKKNKTGFTIIETLLVVATMGALFLSTAALINGQTDRYQQKDAVFQLESTLRNILNDVSNGYYPDVGKGVECSATGTDSIASARADSLTTTVGTNQDCVFAGKKITFEATGIKIESLAANAARTTTPNVALSNDVAVIAGLTETKTYQWGVKPTTNTVNEEFYLLNANYGATMSSGGTFKSGAQNVIVVDKTNSILTPSSHLNLYCFENGSAHSRIYFTGSSSLQVSSEVKSSCL